MSVGTSQTMMDERIEIFASQLESRLSGLSVDRGETWVARACGTLDVMGGIAEYTGALTLSTPACDGAIVAVLPRQDQRLRVICIAPGGARRPDNGHVTEVTWELSRFYNDAGGTAPAKVIREAGRQVGCKIKQAVLSVAYAFLAHGRVEHLGGGFTVIVECGIPGAVQAREVASVQAATAATFARALRVDIEPRQLALLCQWAQCAMLGMPCGIGTHASPFLGKPGSLLEVGCRPFEIGDALEIPAGVAIVGVNCGAVHRAAEEKYLHARTAALMGREIVRRVLESSGRDEATWAGYLSRISVGEYVDSLRDRLPTKLKGSLYLERFGELDDELAFIDPDAVYKVRSRAEHHIYEDDRVRKFAEKLARMGRTGEHRVLIDAGEFMYASHWSYGQRCGLGSIESDLLVNLLRAAGPDQGVYGARVSGPGGGGTVVVLMNDSPETHETLQGVLKTYEERCRKAPNLRPLAAKGTAAIAVERCA